MSEVRNESGHGVSAPLAVKFSIAATVIVGILTGLLGIYYSVLWVGLGLFPLAGLAVCLAAGFVVAAIAISRRDPDGRSALTALAIAFIPGLPIFMSTYVNFAGDPDPRWWPISVAIAVALVVPVWLPGSNRWFTRSRRE